MSNCIWCYKTLDEIDVANGLLVCNVCESAMGDVNDPYYWDPREGDYDANGEPDL